MVILEEVCRDIRSEQHLLALHPRKRIFDIGKYMNRPLGRQKIGAVVSISNSRMGFFIEEKQFKT